MQEIETFWKYDADTLLQKTSSSITGLTEKEAAARLIQQHNNNKIPKGWQSDLRLFLQQYKSPLVLLLVFAVLLSFFLKEYSNGIIILIVLTISGILGFIQERSAGKAVEKLKALVQSMAMVRRDKAEREIPVEEVVEGDIILLNAGDIVPADSFILEAVDLHVNESALTGESFPVEKFAGSSDKDTPSTSAKNTVFKGTSVINGIATVLAVNTGNATEFGKIVSQLNNVAVYTAFEKGILQFGYLLMRLTAIIATLILTINLLLNKPAIDSILFALALAVGLTPELLPAIVTITMAAGAKRLAAKRVIVKKLSAIQNLGEMDVLCSDKTGTITEGTVRIHKTIDAAGKENSRILQYAYLNAFFETGFSNPIDQAICNTDKIDITGYIKRDEVPYDFIRKRLSIVVDRDGKSIMITKGAVKNILEVCTTAEITEKSNMPIEQATPCIENIFSDLSAKGFRVIGISYKDVSTDPVITKEDETEMTFLGFIVFYDPPKDGIIESIVDLRQTGIELKIITGDNQLVAKHLAEKIGLSSATVLTGYDLYNMPDEALQVKIKQVDVFAEIVPAQKERIVKALQKTGSSVGYMGDGINDANALKAADVGISTDNAVDVAKEAADIVLLDRNIDAIRNGVLEGRRTFANTLKYIHVTTSANFGNMLSMAIASVVLPFLPLLPVQILLNNFLSDIPAISISSDKVDKELIEKPRRWNISYIKRFMFVFGLESSFFDFVTFAVLLYIFKTSENEFQTAWFIESLLTEVAILLIIRTNRSFFKSKPSRYLLFATLLTFIVSIFLPYLPVAAVFGLVPLPFKLILILIIIILTYVIVSEISKKFIMKKL